MNIYRIDFNIYNKGFNCMSKKLLLTVNVITYNHAPYIAKCLDSILSQKTNFRFIIRIFDDCSTDGTLEICYRYAKKYPNTVFLFPSEKNLGIVYNPLRSYEEISTPYYLFIEGDDYRINKYGFQRQIDALEKYPECSFCCANTINEKNGKFGDIHPCLGGGRYAKEDILENPDILFYTHLMTRIVRTKYINIDPEYTAAYLNDISQMYELLDQGPFYFIPDIFGCYVITGKGIVTSKKLFSKVQMSFEACYNYDIYSKNKYELNILNFFIIDIISFYQEQKKYMISDCKKNIINYVNHTNKKKSSIVKWMHTFRAILYLFIPGILPYIAHKVRDFFRYARKRISK